MEVRCKRRRQEKQRHESQDSGTKTSQLTAEGSSFFSPVVQREKSVFYVKYAETFHTHACKVTELFLDADIDSKHLPNSCPGASLVVFSTTKGVFQIFNTL